MVRLSNRVVMKKSLLERLLLFVNRIGQISNHFIEDLKLLAVLAA
jgi:hypothetical protein